MNNVATDPNETRSREGAVSAPFFIKGQVVEGDEVRHRSRDLGVEVEVVDYSEHAVTAGTDATAVAYVEVQDAHGNVRWGVGMDESILAASLKVVLSAVSRGR